MRTLPPRSLLFASGILATVGLSSLVSSCRGETETPPAPDATTSEDSDTSLPPIDSIDPDELTPRVRLRLSGQLEGYLEPCGCAANQLGGLARRAFSLQQDRDYDVLIEGGNLLSTATELDIMKLQVILTVLSDNASTYHALGVGPSDLRLPDDLYFMFVSGFGIPPLAADLVPRPLADGSPWPLIPFHEMDAGEGAKVRLTSLVSQAVKGFELLPAQQAWTAAMEGVAPSTYRVLLSHGGTTETEALTSLNPKPDLIVGINAVFPEPPNDPRVVDGVPIVYPGSRGRYLLDVWLTRHKDQPRITRYRDVSLAGSKTAANAHKDPNVIQLLLGHRNNVKDAEIREEMAEQLPAPGGGTYVGSATCAGCHVSATKTWQASRHGHAWKTLETAEGSEKYPWPVTHYPDCVQCHTVGYQQKSGFINPERTPHLKDVGCEECHGPGSKHIANPAAGGFLPQTVERCMRCHTYEQTPLFEAEYDRYWKMIEHGKDG